MSASITLSNLSWSTPDDRAVFSGLDLQFSEERAGLVGRNGVGKTTLLKLIAEEQRPQSGSIAISGTIGILRQSLQLSETQTVADLFDVTEAWALLRKAEQGEASIDELADADWMLEDRMMVALGQVGLDARPDTLLVELSGGQRTRASLAGVVFGEPDFLLLDEPTNNLDRGGRDAVIALLGNWRAGAIVVSHDRELLETMDAIVEMTTLSATRYGGNWSYYRERKTLELDAAQRDLADAEKQVAEARQAAQQTAERKARKDGTGKRKAAKGDMPRILTGAMKRRAEETSGNNSRLAERQKSQAMKAATDARQKLEILQPFSVMLEPTMLPANKTVVELGNVTVGYVDSEPVLSNFSFTITGPERVAIMGANGSGKTTLLSLITGRLQPWSGTVRVIPEYAMLDQRASLLDPDTSIRDNFMQFNPGADENNCRAALARFMFRADAALQIVGTLSGGQMLRAALACVLGGKIPPQLLILDEPTNHLDIDSIEAVEAGLRAYDGALLIVSHDDAFLDAVGITSHIWLRGV